jgi:hypothetical protein
LAKAEIAIGVGNGSDNRICVKKQKICPGKGNLESLSTILPRMVLCILCLGARAANSQDEQKENNLVHGFFF